MKINTTIESILTGGGGSVRFLDGVTYTGVQILSIIPEGDVTVSVLQGYGPDGDEEEGGEQIDYRVTRRLTSMKDGKLYTAGRNSWFANITVTGGDVTGYLV